MRLTRGQKNALINLRDSPHEFIEHNRGWGRCQANRCFWKLVGLELAEFDFGPKQFSIRTQGYMITNKGKEIVANL